MLNEVVLMMSLAGLGAEQSTVAPANDRTSVMEGMGSSVCSGASEEDPERTWGWWQKLTSWGGRKEVLISGRVVSPYTDMSDVLVLAELPDGSFHGSRSGDNGRFTVSLPLEAEVRLRFRKAGHVEKIVTVDTRNAVDGRKARRLSRGVKFDVELLPEERLSGFTYDGPVGTISFVRGSGLMKVTYHEQLIHMTSLR